MSEDNQSFQFKPEAELYQYRQIIVTIGCVTMGIGKDYSLFYSKLLSSSPGQYKIVCRKENNKT